MPKAKPGFTNGRRRPLTRRPWLNSTMHDRLAGEFVLHADVFAFDAQRFTIEYWQSGKKLMRATHWQVIGGALQLCRQPDPRDAIVFWTPETNDVFRRVHPALLARIRETYYIDTRWKALTIHCHYVRVPDWPPFDRGFVNHYKKRQRSRAVEPVALPLRMVATANGVDFDNLNEPDDTLPDWF